MVSWLVGALAGVVATAGMTFIELVARSRWGFASLLDWQINQATLARITKKPAEDLVLAGLALHVLHGLLGGIVFVLALALFPPAWPVLLLGLGFGALLFVLTLLVVRPVTREEPASGPNGLAAIAVALLTHLVYGAVLALLVVGR